MFVMLAEELGIGGVALDVPDALLTKASYGHDVDEGIFEGRAGRNSL